VLTSFPTRNLVMTVPVTLTVSPTTVPFLDNLPGHLSFSLIPGAPAPSSQIFSIRNKGTGTLGWASITGTGDGGSWLHISAAQGNAPSSVAISVTPANLPNGGLVAGTFVGQILIATATGNVSVPVVVFVGNQVFSQVNPLSFTMPLAGANPLPQIMTIASDGKRRRLAVSFSRGQQLLCNPRSPYGQYHGPGRLGCWNLHRRDRAYQFPHQEFGDDGARHPDSGSPHGLLLG